MKQQLSPLSATICALTFHRLFEFSDYIVAIETLLPSLCLSRGCRNKLDIIWIPRPPHRSPTLCFTSGYLECTSSAAHGNLAPASCPASNTQRRETMTSLQLLLQLWMSAFFVMVFCPHWVWVGVEIESWQFNVVIIFWHFSGKCFRAAGMQKQSWSRQEILYKTCTRVWFTSKIIYFSVRKRRKVQKKRQSSQVVLNSIGF